MKDGFTQVPDQADAVPPDLAVPLLAHAADAIICADAEFRIRFANANAEQLLGYAPGELLGVNLNTLLPPQSRQRHAQMMQAFAQLPQPSRQMVERSAVTALRRDGSEVPVTAAIACFQWRGELIYSVQLRLHQSALYDVMNFFSRYLQEQKMLALLSAAGSVVSMNPFGVQFSGEPLPVGKAWLGLPCWQALSARDAVRLANGLQAAADGWAFTTRLLLAWAGRDGEVEVALMPVVSGERSFMIGAEVKQVAHTV